MVRTVWIGLFCLIAICGMTAYKIGFAAPAKSEAVSAEPAAVIADAQDVSATRDASAIQVATTSASATKEALASREALAIKDVSATRDAPATNDAPANNAPANDAQANDAPATKTDRLDVDYLQDVPNKTLVHTIPIVISDPAVPATKTEPEKAPAEKVAKIAGRHWRSSYARLTRRHVRREREVSQPTKDVQPGHTGLLGWLASASSAKR